MRFEEKPGCAGGDGGAGERGNKFALSAGTSQESSGKLNAVRCIHNRRTIQAVHNRERAHIDDKILVSESRSPVGEPNFPRSRDGKFIVNVAHFLRRKELPFFDIYTAPRACGGDEQVRLAAEESRDLENIANLLHFFALFRQVDIRENGKLEFPLHHREQLQAGIQARTAKSADGGAICFVERAFEDDVQLGEILTQNVQFLGYFPADGFVFEGAGTCDEQKLFGVVNHGVEGEKICEPFFR